MNNLVLLSLLISILLIPLGANSAFAQVTYTIKIPTGAASPDAPYFWQSEKDGDATGNIQVRAKDTIRWANADTAAHTVTSGTIADGPDGKFDSGLFGPGKDFKFQFNTPGKYEYFCLIHTWMTGIVTVTSGLQVIPNVGEKVGDGKTSFNVEYEFNRVIASASINEKQKSITFELVGKPKGDNNNLTLMLPKGLISDPLIIWVDGQQITDFKITPTGGINHVIIPLNEKSERLTIVGAAVVPEFGVIAIAILAIGIFSIIALSLKTQKIGIIKF